jgi:hypothetical protein
VPDQCRNDERHDALRFHAVNREAAELGYRIKVELEPNTRPPVCSAHAQVLSESIVRRFLCRASTSIEAAKGGLGILRSGEPA